MFVDADDWLEPNAFDIISKNFKKKIYFVFLTIEFLIIKLVPEI
jgi:hypothetical protein